MPAYKRGSPDSPLLYDTNASLALTAFIKKTQADEPCPQPTFGLFPTFYAGTPEGILPGWELSRENFSGASDRNRTSDTRIFSPLLYRLSYRGISGPMALDLRQEKAVFSFFLEDEEGTCGCGTFAAGGSGTEQVSSEWRRGWDLNPRPPA